MMNTVNITMIKAMLKIMLKAPLKNLLRTSSKIANKTLSGILLLALSVTAHANEVEITNVVAHQKSDKTWTFAVTLKHADEGWDHYANEWQVLAPDNKVLATRTLYHPHVDEQPFTRNTSGVKISASMTSVRIIAKDTVHGLAKTAMQVNLKTKELTAVKLEMAKK